MVEILLIPFGLHVSGRMVGPDDVARGMDCQCVCPECHRPLVAKQGDEVAHHFAHLGLQNCTGAAETALHKMAKQVLCEARQIRLPGSEVTINGISERIQWPATWTYSEAIQEVRMDNFQPDVILKATIFRTVAAEIRVTHQTDADKCRKFQESGLDAIEIDLSGYPRVLSPATLRRLVVQTADRHWLFNGLTYRAQAAKQALHAAGKEWRYP